MAVEGSGSSVKYDAREWKYEAGERERGVRR
jgi:hypothetical protein